MAPPWLKQLHEHFQAQRWAALVEAATAARAEHPLAPQPYWFGAHALRQLGRIDEGYQWAKEGLAVAPDDLLVLSRAALLSNLTGRFGEAFELAVRHAGRAVTDPNDRYNLATLITNGIHAAAKLSRIGEAVASFRAPIERLDSDALHFNAACLFALANDPACFVHMEKALAGGKPASDFADADFDAVREAPQFVTLLERDWPRERAALARAGVTDRALLRPEHFVDPSRLTTGASEEAPLEAFEADITTAPESWQVLFDWLHERRHPRAAIWETWTRATEANELTERMLASAAFARALEADSGRLVGPAVAWWRTLSWRGGFVERLRVDLKGAELGLGGLVPSTSLAEALAHPACRFVGHLEVRDVDFEDVGFDYGPLLDVVAAANLGALRSLRVEPDDVTRSWTELTCERLGERFARLTSLELGAGPMQLGTLDFTALERFALRTTGLTREAFTSVLTARWPALQSLELWFGSTSHGGDAFEASELTPLLSGALPTGVRALALKNAEFTDGLIEVLARSPLLPRLERLDLSLGTLTDAGASALLQHARAFEHLGQLDLTENVMSADAVADVVARLPAAVVTSQKRSRYVSVAE